MSRITNLQGLPQPIVDAITNDPYDSGASDISITRLISPVRQVELIRRHADEITEDASDRIWAIMGQLGHSILERAAKDKNGKDSGNIAEKRLFAEVQGWKVSGQVDLISGVLTDYKFTSTYAVKEGVKTEWVQQLNLNRWLAHKNGIAVEKLEIIAILRDWSKPEAMRNPDLPQAQVIVLPVEVWSLEAAEAFMEQRVWLHQSARAASDADLLECSSEEMWERPEKYAVKKIGGVRASKLYDTEREARAAVKQGQEVEHRPGERPRCQSYCSASPFCSQFKAWEGSKK